MVPGCIHIGVVYGIKFVWTEGESGLKLIVTQAASMVPGCVYIGVVYGIKFVWTEGESGF